MSKPKGRPTHGDAPKVRLFSRVSASSVAAIKEKAKATGLPVSQAIERALIEWAPTPPQVSPQP